MAAEPSRDELVAQSVPFGVGLGGFRRGLEELAAPVREGMRPGALQETFRRALRGTSGPGAFVAGAATQATVEGGRLAGLLSAGPVTPMNLPMKAVDAVLSGRVSDLIRPHLPGQGPGDQALNRMLEELDWKAQTSDAADFGRFVGEWVPALTAGGLVAGSMRRILLAEAPGLLRTMGSRKLLNSFSARTAKAMAAAGDRLGADQLLRAQGELAGGIPWFERTLMAVGNGMGFGTFEAVREVSAGGKIGDAVRTGALVAGAGTVGEMGLVAAGRALFPSFRRGAVDVAKLRDRWRELTPEVRDAVVAGDMTVLRKLWRGMALEPKGGRDFLTRGEKALSNLIDEGVLEVSDEFVKATASMTSAERVQRLGRALRLVREQKGKWETYLAKQMGLIGESVPWGGEMATAREEFIAHVQKLHGQEAKLHAAYQNIKSLGLMDSAAPIVRRALDSSPVCPQQLLKEAEDLGWALAKARAEGGGGRLAQATNALHRAFLSTHVHLLESWKVKYLSSPSGLARELGVSGLRFADLVEEAQWFIRTNRWKMYQELDALAQWAKQKGVDLRAVRDMWEETGNLEAVRDRFGTEAAEMWNKGVVKPLEFYGRALQKIGVNSMLSETERLVLGTPGYFPHVVKSTFQIGRMERAVAASLRRRGMNASQVDDALNAGAWKATGARRFSTVDFQRKLTGTTAEKVKGGMPLENDPLVALRDHLDSSIMRLGMGVRFGPNWELGSAYKAAMIAEGGSERAANMLVDSVLFERTADGFAARLARNVAASQIILKLSWAALPNAFQSAMTGIRFGMKATAVGSAEATRDFASNARWLREGLSRTIASEDKATIAAALGYLERSLMSLQTVFEGGQPRTLMEKVAERMMKATGFTGTERMNRMVAAHAALADARWTVTKMARGELRGEAYVHARRGLDSLGVDIDRVLARYARTGRLGLSAKEVDSVITQGVKQTQFSTGVLDVPAAWRTPVGRVAAQFKTFALNAGKLTRDQVFREFDQGNYRPLMYWLGLGGLSGDAIGIVTDMAKGRERDVPDGPLRIIEDLSNFGGFGLVRNYVDAALYGEPLEFLAGPLLSDLAGQSKDLIVAARYGRPGALLGTARRQPVTRLAGRVLEVGAYGAEGAAEAIHEGWDWVVDEGPGGGEDLPTLDEWRKRLPQ